VGYCFVNTTPRISNDQGREFIRHLAEYLALLIGFFFTNSNIGVACHLGIISTAIDITADVDTDNWNGSAG
jgi:hypothetical protein